MRGDAMKVTTSIMIVIVGLVQVATAAPPVDYSGQVKPILTARCTSCHGSIRQKAGLRLDTAEFILRGGKRGPAVEPGKSDRSLLIHRVTAADSSNRMPPESQGVSLSSSEVTVLRAWIDQGAKAPPERVPEDPRQHWAYQPIVRPKLPGQVDRAWARNPIDAFLAASYQSRGLKPSPPLAKDLWLRRVYLDLIGLLPTQDERRAYLADGSPDAEGRVVDRLLADPRHGERWGRHWMDVWRYSDWYGLGDEVRYSHPHIWQWRDWIVASVNADKGYDRMIEEMVAGDELAPDDQGTLRATGFLVRNWDIFNRNAWLANTVEHTARAFLGLTIQCARCHDHKFDPVSQTEYYQLRAFFEPYHIRVDRVPGQPDRTKSGLPRAFDDFVETPTYLFVRGDETTPDKTRAMRPATPAVLGGEVKIVPVSLSRGAACPDKRDFVIREAVEAVHSAVAQARSVAAASRKAAEHAAKQREAAAAADSQAEAKVKAAAGMPEALKTALTTAGSAVEARAKAERALQAAREDQDVAASALALAEAKQSALNALLHAERLEDEGAKSSGSAAWNQAARNAADAQRLVATLEASFKRLSAQKDLNRARSDLDSLIVAGAGQKDDAFKNARAKAALALVEARARLADAEGLCAKAAAAAKTPLSTAYTPRPLEFPRAKTTYRDTPSNAPYRNFSTGRRLALARWIVDRHNPLTARVAVNHVWARHFGEPLAGSMYDFGLRTRRPVHLSLLDWLAAEFMESGWSFKHLHRLILTSRAYRMSASGLGPSDTNAAVDPDNHYFWRMNERRMEGEVVRDCVLFLAGNLDFKIGGPDQPVAAAETGSRRTIYYRYASGDNIPLLSMFDAANVTECYRRYETIVPQQALALTNSAMVMTGAAEIATLIDHEFGSGSRERPAYVAAVFERLLGRMPTEAERAECLSGLVRLAASFESDRKSPHSPEGRARSALVHVLLNHNDFVSIR
jgi:hypothetical protein